MSNSNINFNYIAQAMTSDDYNLIADKKTQTPKSTIFLTDKNVRIKHYSGTANDWAYYGRWRNYDGYNVSFNVEQKRGDKVVSYAPMSVGSFNSTAAKREYESGIYIAITHEPNAKNNTTGAAMLVYWDKDTESTYAIANGNVELDGTPVFTRGDQEVYGAKKFYGETHFLNADYILTLQDNCNGVATGIKSPRIASEQLISGQIIAPSSGRSDFGYEANKINFSYITNTNKGHPTIAPLLTLDSNGLTFPTYSSKAKHYLGYATDQSDGTVVWSLTGTNYQSGLAIGATTGKLMWKTKRVLTEDDFRSYGLKLDNVGLTIEQGGTNTTVPTISMPIAAVPEGIVGQFLQYGENGSLQWGDIVITIDAFLDKNSTNPVQNKVVTTAIEEAAGTTYTLGLDGISTITLTNNKTEDDQQSVTLPVVDVDVAGLVTTEALDTIVTDLRTDIEEAAGTTYTLGVQGPSTIILTDKNGDLQEAELPTISVDAADIATKSYVDDAIDSVDVSDQLQNYVESTTFNSTVETLENKISAAAGTTYKLSSTGPATITITNEKTNIPQTTELPTISVTDANIATMADVVAAAGTTYELRLDTETSKLSLFDLKEEQITSQVNLANGQLATQAYVNQKVADLVNSAPSTLDTLGELAAAIENHEDAYDALLTTVGNKANQSELDYTNNLLNDATDDIASIQTKLDSTIAIPTGTNGLFLKWDNGFTWAEADKIIAATSSTLGGIKLGYSNTTEKKYAVELDGEQRAYVAVPWTDTKYVHPTFTAYTGALTSNQTPSFGGTFNIGQIVTNTNGHVTNINTRTIKIPDTLASSSAPGLMSTEDKNKLDDTFALPSGVENYFLQYKNGTLIWSKADELVAATESKLGGVKIGYTTNSTNRNYAVLLDTNDKAYVNVPWENTEYTFATNGSGNALTGFSKSGNTITFNTATYNNYVHPTGAGYKHIPSGGTAGQVLKSNGSDAYWANDKDTTYSTATTSTAGLMSAADKSKLDSALPITFGNGLDFTDNVLSVSNPLLEDYVKKSGDTMTGNLTVGSSSIGTNGYIQGTWLKTTAVSDLGSAPSRYPVFDSSGWIYSRTAAQTKTDLGIPTTYAGSSTAGGAATSANKLNTNAGSSSVPVYFSGGIPVVCETIDASSAGIVGGSIFEQFSIGSWTSAGTGNGYTYTQTLTKADLTDTAAFWTVHAYGANGNEYPCTWTRNDATITLYSNINNLIHTVVVKRTNF